jgi:S-adenosylmethionine decarboxylase
MTKSRSPSPLPSPPYSPRFDLATQDETLEILMTHLDNSNAEKFYLNGIENASEEGHISGSIVAEACGLNDIYPVDPHCGGRLDGYSFAPCGFSANAVIAPPETKPFTSEDHETSGHYFTVHVTPEQGYSYASFETNVPGDMFPGRGTREVVSRVIKGFRPGRMCITKFISHQSKNTDTESEDGFGRDSGFIDSTDIAVLKAVKWDWKVAGYRRIEKVIYEFDGYDLIFASFVRND